MTTIESELEKLFIEKLRGLKYDYRPDIRLPQRGHAYQPRVQPWERDGGYECVLKERRKSPNGGRVIDQPRCGVPSERGNLRAVVPRALPWAGMRGPVGAGITCPVGA